MADLQRGLVKWFNDAKGFGFIEHTSGRDVFVHYSVIQTDGFKTLKDGEEVNYELCEGDKGLHAAKVIRVNAPLKESKKADSDMVAPNLETGSINTITKSVSDMIEVERISSSGSQQLNTTLQEISDEDEAQIEQ